MIIWLNGGFGAGKTTLADTLAQRLPRAVIFDPELIGSVLSHSVPPVDDFQDLASWRELVVSTALSLLRHHGDTLIVPMALLRDDHRDEILEALRRAGEPVLAVFLAVPPDPLRRRLEARQDPAIPREAQEAARHWGIARIEAAVEAADRQPHGTLVLAADELSPDELAGRVLDALPGALDGGSGPRLPGRGPQEPLGDAGHPMTLRLRPLDVDDEPEALAAQAELARDGFTFLLFHDPSRSWATYLEGLEAMRRGSDVPAGMVPSSFLVAEVDGRLVGRVSIRHELNAWLERIGGHIGYGVRPSERRRGYATEMLRQALVITRSLGIDRALVTCDEDNLASARTIERCGGAFEGLVPDEGTVSKRRYWV